MPGCSGERWGLSSLLHHVSLFPGISGDHILVGIIVPMQEFDCECSWGEIREHFIIQSEVPISAPEGLLVPGIFLLPLR